MLKIQFMLSLWQFFFFFFHVLPVFYSAGGRPLKARVAGVTVKEDTDWLEMIWTFVTGLIAPDDEEEGIHQLTETFTCKKTSPHTSNPLKEVDH